jgi:hypothetical protein
VSYAIKAQFETSASQEDVGRWLRTPEGIAGWWSDRVSGEAGEVGDTFEVGFPTTPVVFELRVSESSDEVVEWTIDENPPWWKGTAIRFELAPGDAGSKMLFTHSGFDPEDQIIQVITPAWVRFLDNLVKVAETGNSNPAVRN